MIAWLSLAGACLLATVAVLRLVRRPPIERPDPDWGDWPPDQMAS